MVLLHNFRLRLFSSKLICCKDFTQSVQLHNTGSEICEVKTTTKQDTVTPLYFIITKRIFTSIKSTFTTTASNLCLNRSYFTIPSTSFIISSVTLLALAGYLRLFSTTLWLLSAVFMLYRSNFWLRSACFPFFRKSFLFLSEHFRLVLLRIFYPLYFFTSLKLTVTVPIFPKTAMFSGKFVLSKRLFYL